MQLPIPRTILLVSSFFALGDLIPSSASRDNQPERDNWETNYFRFCVRSTGSIFHLVLTYIHAGITGRTRLVS